MGNNQSCCCKEIYIDAKPAAKPFFNDLDDILIANMCEIFTAMTPTTSVYDHHKNLISLFNFAMVDKRTHNIVYHSMHSPLIWKGIDLHSVVCIVNSVGHEIIGYHSYDILDWPGAQYCTEFTHFISRNFKDTRTLTKSMPRLEKLCMKIPKTGVNVAGTIAEIAKVPTLRHLELTIDSIDQIVPVIKFSSNIVELVIKQCADSKVDWNLCTFDSVTDFSIENITFNFSELKLCPNAKVLKITGREQELFFEMIPKFPNLEALDLSTDHVSEISETLSAFALDGRGKKIRELVIDNHRSYAWQTELSWNSIVRDFPNLVKLHILEIPVNHADVKALSNLKHLEELGLTSSQTVENILGYSDAFAEFGRSDGGKSLKSLCLKMFNSCDLGDFFSSRKCHELRRIEFKSCDFSTDSLSKLASNVAESLIHLEISTVNGDKSSNTIKCREFALFAETKAFEHVVLIDIGSLYEPRVQDPCAIYWTKNFTLDMMSSDLSVALVNISELTIAIWETLEIIQKFKDWTPYCTKLSMIHTVSKDTTEQHFQIKKKK